MVCPNGAICPANGICPIDPPQNCPIGTSWDPLNQICAPIQPIVGGGGPNMCNVLGIAFNGTAPGTGIGPTANCSIAAILLALLQWFAWIVAVVAVVYGIRGGYLYITSGGDEAKLTESKKAVIYTMIGVIVAIVSFGIIAIARAFLNI
jgi:hypothetical protein